MNVNPPLVLESFAELRARGVVSSRATLHRWQTTAGFPRPIKLGTARRVSFVRRSKLGSPPAPPRAITRNRDRRRRVTLGPGVPQPVRGARSLKRSRLREKLDPLQPSPTTPAQTVFPAGCNTSRNSSTSATTRWAPDGVRSPNDAAREVRAGVNAADPNQTRPIVPASFHCCALSQTRRDIALKSVRMTIG